MRLTYEYTNALGEYLAQCGLCNPDAYHVARRLHLRMLVLPAWATLLGILTAIVKQDAVIAAALTLNTAPGNGRYFKRFDGAPKGVFEDPDYTPFEEDGTEYRFTSPTNVRLSQNSAVAAVFSVDLVRSLGLFLVALPDPAAASFPLPDSPFARIDLGHALPVPALVIASENDPTWAMTLGFGVDHGSG